MVQNVTDKEWEQYVETQVKIYFPKVFSVQNPSLDDTLIYFKFNQILNEQFNRGTDHSQHPLNPFNKNKKNSIVAKLTIDSDKKITDNNTMTLTEKDNKIIAFLENRILELRNSIYAKEEPSMQEAMTFFAYSNLLFKKYKIGIPLSNHPRNPWKGGIVPPLELDEYQQIEKLPLELRQTENVNTKTQVIPTIENAENQLSPVQTVQPLPPAPIELWRVFDCDTPNITVYQGPEAECFKYSTKGNKDAGYKAFDYVKTGVKYIPKQKKTPSNGVTVLPHETIKQHNQQHSCQIGTCGTAVITSRYSSWVKPAKIRVKEYLEKEKNSTVLTHE